jgi:predicted ATPase
MVDSLRVRNFKCFQSEQIALQPLTLLTGANGAGKSSLLQALLLYWQARSERAPTVKLNGPYLLQLGQALDVLHGHGVSGEREVQIEIRQQERTLERCRLGATDDDATVLPVLERPDAPPAQTFVELTYLNAERIGPRQTMPVQSRAPEVTDVGPQGEWTAQVLAQHGLKRIRRELVHPSSDRVGGNPSVAKQTELWMRDLIPGLELRPAQPRGAGLAALEMRKMGMGTEWLTPPNMGFGASYALPVILAGLLCRPGSLLLVENPEAHLHSPAQSLIGRFLATLAVAGVQVIAETHSEHVLNGVRLAALDEHPIRHDQIIIHYFHGEAGKPGRAQPIHVNSRGGLSDSPRGFFDQSERDLASILRARKNA